MPNFFSDFGDDCAAAGLRKTLSMNILGIDIFKVDDLVVDYFSRLDQKDSPPFDPVEVARKLNMIVTYDDFGSGSQKYGELCKPHFRYNQTDMFRISVNQRLQEAEKRFTVSHEIAERLMCYEGEKEILANMSPPYYRAILKELACNKIAREVLFPTPVVNKLGEMKPSLNHINELAGVYEAPVSQTALKVIADLRLMDAALSSENDTHMSGIYGNSGLLVGNVKLPVCEYGCESCEKKRGFAQAEAISSNMEKLNKGEKVEGLVRENWKEAPVPEAESTYWITYRSA